MTHLVQGLYGGLEHKNSTALQFCSRGFKKDKDYLNWLCPCESRVLSYMEC